MSESDFSRWENPGTAKPSLAIPQFYTEAVHQPFRSEQEGRPIFEEREFVKILIPGDRRAMVVEPVNDDHKARWPSEYAAFKAGQEAPIEGTPLTEWAVSSMNKARAEELAYFNIKTVEQLAQVNDNQLQNLGMGARELRERAKTWLEIAQNGSAPIEKLISGLEQAQRDIVRLTADLQTVSTDRAVLAGKLAHKEAQHAGA